MIRKEFWPTLLRSHHSTSVRLRSGLGSLQHLGSFLSQPFCCRFAAVPEIISLLHDSIWASLWDRWPHRILWYTKEFMTDSKTAGPIHHRPDISTLASSVQRTLFRKSCVVFSCHFASLNCAAVFFIERRSFFFAVLPEITKGYCKGAAVRKCSFPTLFLQHGTISILFCTPEFKL